MNNGKDTENFDNFPERIGYACLNTELRARKPSVFCSRTARLATLKDLGKEHAMKLGRENVLDLKQILLWNEAHGIRFMRMSSDMFPFASHDEFGYSVLYCKEELESVGELAKKMNHRLTMHPGQTNNLGSPHAKVLEATRRDLAYHAEIMDTMKLGKDSVMIIHMGGTYGDKAATIARFEQEFVNLPQNVRDRLVIENDEICYNTEELLPTCEKLSIPLVFDWHHHSINPGTVPLDELLERVKKTWQCRNIRQKMHYSESRPGAKTITERRAHSDYVQRIPFVGKDIDLMIEAKMKEKSALYIMNKYLWRDVPSPLTPPPC